jgi:Kef-type K+ transport system membrane component KefB
MSLFFLVIWASPLAFEFLELLCLFWLSHGFFSFLIEIFFCPPVWGVILVGIFFMKEKLFKLKKGSQGMYVFQNVKGITKIGFPHFKHQQL